MSWRHSTSTVESYLSESHLFWAAIYTHFRGKALPLNGSRMLYHYAMAIFSKLFTGRRVYARFGYQYDTYVPVPHFRYNSHQNSWSPLSRGGRPQIKLLSRQSDLHRGQTVLMPTLINIRHTHVWEPYFRIHQFVEYTVHPLDRVTSHRESIARLHCTLLYLVVFVLYSNINSSNMFLNSVRLFYLGRFSPNQVLLLYYIILIWGVFGDNLGLSLKKHFRETNKSYSLSLEARGYVLRKPGMDFFSELSWDFWENRGLESE